MIHITIVILKKCRKEGIVYLFKDIDSGYVRAVKTTENSDESSVKSKQSSSFEGIKNLYKTATKH